MKFLCAVTKKDDRYYQVLTEATLHNIPLRIIPLRGLDGHMPQQELNLIQFATCKMAQTRTCPPEIVRR